MDAKFERGVKNYNQSLKRADKETKKATASMANSWQLSGDQIDRMVSEYVKDTNQVVKQTQKTASNTRKQTQAINASFLDATAKIAVWAAAASIAFDQFERGARESAARGVFVRLSGGAANATANINALREATGSAASNQALMEQATTLLNLKIAKSSDELGRAARSITTTAAAAKGFTAEQAINSFTLLASNFESSKARLDDFGLSLDDVQPKIDAYKAAGKEASEAIRLALLDALDEKFDQLGGNVETTAKGIDRFKAAQDNLVATFRAAISSGEGFGKILEFVTRGLNAGAQAITFFAGGVGAIIELVTSVDDLIAGTLTLDEVLQNASDAGFQAFTDSAQALGVFTDDMGAATEATEELGDATVETAGDIEKFNESIAQARTSAIEAFLKRAISAERQLEDAAISRARRVEDFERQAAARRAQIEQQYAATVAGIQDQAAEDRRTRQINLARQLEQIERQYQERKRDINQQFAVSFSRAVRSRDAVALVEAIRTRAKDLEEAKRQRDQERSEATTDAQRQEEEQQRSLERQLAAARAAREQQLAEAQAAQEKQIEDQRRADERQAEDRALADARWLQDQQRAFQDRQARAMAAYRQNENIYQQHLQRMLQLTNQMLPRIFPPQLAGGGGRPRGAGGGGGPTMLADGGAFIANGATPFVAGEAGPELVIAAPLSQISNVNPAGPQAVGQMRHDVSGQIQASMAGFQGRLTAAINDAVTRSIREVLR